LDAKFPEEVYGRWGIKLRYVRFHAIKGFGPLNLNAPQEVKLLMHASLVPFPHYLFFVLITLLPASNFIYFILFINVMVTVEESQLTALLISLAGHLGKEVRGFIQTIYRV